MKYVKVEWDDEDRGFVLGAGDYLAVLAQGLELPAGASAFARQPGHYDFTGRRCVKDLALERISWSPTGAGILQISFLPHPAKHDEGLTLSYRGVSEFSVGRSEADPAAREPDTVLLDELLPAEEGCAHEIELTNSCITVVAADLEAVWGAPGASVP
ncbi:hypothetical protein [Kitasatospora sp. NPDC094015]|uniref:hypothetical protein n=1 Tax=Kitasatospora sp. NPDC094015 TaxID=3155205 RepID=UPI003327C23D